jgi:hypothetical protein
MKSSVQVLEKSLMVLLMEDCAVAEIREFSLELLWILKQGRFASKVQETFNKRQENRLCEIAVELSVLLFLASSKIRSKEEKKVLIELEAREPPSARIYVKQNWDQPGYNSEFVRLPSTWKFSNRWLFEFPFWKSSFMSHLVSQIKPCNTKVRGSNHLVTFFFIAIALAPPGSVFSPWI